MQSEAERAAEILERTRTLFEAFNRRASDSLLEEWVESLSPLYGPELVSALKQGCRQRMMPGLVDILETTIAARRRNASIEAAKVSFDDMVKSASTPEAKAAAEQALAIMREKFGIGQ